MDSYRTVCFATVASKCRDRTIGTLEACQTLFLEWTGTLCEPQLDVLILEARALLSTVHTHTPGKKKQQPKTKTIIHFLSAGVYLSERQRGSGRDMNERPPATTSRVETSMRLIQINAALSALPVLPSRHWALRGNRTGSRA